MKNYYNCPNCNHANGIDNSSDNESFSEKFSKNSIKAVLVTLAGIPTAGIGSILLGGYFYGGAVTKFFNGTKVICENCGTEFNAK